MKYGKDRVIKIESDGSPDEVGSAEPPALGAGTDGRAALSGETRGSALAEVVQPTRRSAKSVKAPE